MLLRVARSFIFYAFQSRKRIFPLLYKYTCLEHVGWLMFKLIISYLQKLCPYLIKFCTHMTG